MGSTERHCGGALLYSGSDHSERGTAPFTRDNTFAGSVQI